MIKFLKVASLVLIFIIIPLYQSECVCNEGYEYIYDDQSCQPIKDYICKEDYYKNNGKCLKKFQNCKDQNSQSRCWECKQDFYLEEEDKCSPVPQKIQNCVEYNSAATCRQCAPLYYIIDNGQKCQQTQVNIEKCETYSGSNSCKYCIRGYHVHQTEPRCVKNLPHCTSNKTTGSLQSQITICSSCGIGQNDDVYYLDPQTKQCVSTTSHGSLQAPIEGCRHYAYMFGKIDCNLGDGIKRYYHSGEVIEDDVSFDKCRLWWREDSCYKCQWGYTLGPNISECQPDPKQTGEMMSNCAYFSIYGNNCSECEEGYTGKYNSRTGFSSCSQCPNKIPQKEKKGKNNSGDSDDDDSDHDDDDDSEEENDKNNSSLIFRFYQINVIIIIVFTIILF